MSYQVPQHIDPNKVFLINHSELEGRLDSDFYNPSYYQIFGSDKVKWVRLKSVIKNLKHPPEYKRVFATEGYQLIRSQNVRPTGINLSESPVFLADEVVQSPSAIFPHVNDILIVRSGVNAGDVAVIEEEYQKVTIGADTLLLNVTQDVMPKFVQIYFMTEIGRKQLNRHITGATNKHLNSYSLKRVYFPKVDLLTQSHCVSIIESAFAENNRKQEQAKALLQSIDDYLLGELGIHLPETKSQTIQDRMFVVNHSELSGDRLDPMFYTSQFSNIVAKLHDSATCKRLGQIAHFSSEIWNQRDYYEKEFPYIEIGAINITDGTIEDVSSVPVEQAPSRAKVIVRTGDIIISTTRPDRGAIIKITENENLYIASTGFSVIRNIDSNINPDYLLAILKHKLILMQMRQRSTGGNYPAITQEELSKIIIPILPLSKQQDIVDHISVIRQQAKALQEEGKAILEQAKKEVEQMILG